MPTFPFPGPAHHTALPPARLGAGGTRILSGVPYASTMGSRPLELDLYLPPQGPAPLTLFFHGGGWALGSRQFIGYDHAGISPSPFERMATAGIAVASVDYRLSGEATWPAQLHDAKAAVRWLRSRAGEIGVDPERIAAWGESAGAHLAALLGLTGGHPVLEGDVGVTGPPSTVAAVVTWYCPSDLAGLAHDVGADPLDATSREARLLGAPPASVPELAAEASPVTHVSGDAPPFLLLHGTADSLVPHVQSERLHAALEAAGAKAQSQTFDGANHIWVGAPHAGAAALDRTIEFLVEQFRQAPSQAVMEPS
ncbi:alpha/beta hydrolase [Pseudofrankia sp. DC12]|uniref:alpha/beta hydrolase n=1 Tax=Pseudofrankia sp. DC12 TaxID=683315 RepID=UPI0006981BB4|nr:alpha/beta hydrolase [Pseudofrankia sp. DC12]